MDNVSSYLFADVHYYVSGSLDPQVGATLLQGGSKRKNYLSDLVTHCIVGENFSENEVSEAKDLYDIPVVTQKWVLLSSKCEKLLPTSGFAPESEQLFSGVSACVSQLSRADAKAIWAMITYYGGACQLKLNFACTHLVVGKPEGTKYLQALHLDGKIKVVTPDWVSQSIREKIREQEELYHPKLLFFPKPLNIANEEFLKSDESTINEPQKLVSPLPATSKESEQRSVSLLDSIEDIVEDVSSAKQKALDQLRLSFPWNQQPVNSGLQDSVPCSLSNSNSNRDIHPSSEDVTSHKEQISIVTDHCLPSEDNIKIAGIVNQHPSSLQHAWSLPNKAEVRPAAWQQQQRHLTPLQQRNPSLMHSINANVTLQQSVNTNVPVAGTDLNKQQMLLLQQRQQAALQHQLQQMDPQQRMQYIHHLKQCEEQHRQQLLLQKQKTVQHWVNKEEMRMTNKDSGLTQWQQPYSSIEQPPNSGGIQRIQQVRAFPLPVRGDLSLQRTPCAQVIPPKLQYSSQTATGISLQQPPNPHQQLRQLHPPSHEQLSDIRDSQFAPHPNVISEKAASKYQHQELSSRPHAPLPYPHQKHHFQSQQQPLPQQQPPLQQQPPPSQAPIKQQPPPPQAPLQQQQSPLQQQSQLQQQPPQQQPQLRSVGNQQPTGMMGPNYVIRKSALGPQSQAVPSKQISCRMGVPIVSSMPNRSLKLQFFGHDPNVRVTGFEGEERRQLRWMILRAGAQYTGYFSCHNTLLICHRPEGHKYVKCHEWKKPAVNVRWLNEILLGLCSGLTAPYDFKYTQFDQEDPFHVDYSIIPHLLNPWKVPIHITTAVLSKFQSRSQLLKRKPVSETSVDKKAACAEDQMEWSSLQIPKPSTLSLEGKPRILFSGAKKMDHIKGKKFYVTPGVHPPRHSLEQIIECAGGQVISRQHSLKYMLECNRSGPVYIIITCEEDLHLVSDAVRANMAVYSVEFILLAIMRQQIDHDLYVYLPGL